MEGLGGSFTVFGNRVCVAFITDSQVGYGHQVDLLLIAGFICGADRVRAAIRNAVVCMNIQVYGHKKVDLLGIQNTYCLLGLSRCGCGSAQVSPAQRSQFLHLFSQTHHKRAGLEPRVSWCAVLHVTRILHVAATAKHVERSSRSP